MKTPFLLTAVIATTLAATAAAADDPAASGCCKMMKKEPAPEPACCCMKMMAKPPITPEPAKLEALVEQLKNAKDGQVLNAFAALLNQVLAERKAAPGKAPEAPAHQH